MAKKNSRPVRVPPEVYDELNNALNERLKKNLISRKECNFTEGFKLISRTPEWQQALKKLMMLPKRK